MVSAFVMIRVNRGEQMNWDNIVKEKVKKIKGVKEVHHIFGRYDLMARVDVETIEQIANVVEDIRYVEGVASTETLIVHGP